MKNSDNVNYFILIGLVFTLIIYRSYLKIDIIGYDYRYYVFIFLIPTILRIMILGYFKREFLKIRINEAKGVFQKGFLILFYLIQGFIFSYLSIGLLANVGWDYSNKKIADSNITETINCPITKFNSGTSRSNPNIHFVFHGTHESLKIDHKTYGQYFDSKLLGYQLQLVVRKGTWNYYILDDWAIIAIK